MRTRAEERHNNLTTVLDESSRLAVTLMAMGEKDVINLVCNDKWMMHVLRTVKSLDLPDWCVCAGFVRSKVWDYLHRYTHGTPLTDVDVVYFDADHPDEATEKLWESKLKRIDSTVPWSVKNQARMHVKNGHVPYTSTIDGISNFPEVATAVGVYLNAYDEVKLVAPYGIDDLVNMIVRPTPYFLSNDKQIVYNQRLDSKQWELIWNRIRIVR